MLKLLGGLKEYFKLQDVITDNAVFRLHNLFTTAMLLCFSLIITGTQYVGNPIQCIVDSGLPNNAINTFCWIMSTYTMPAAFRRHVGTHVAHPGLANDYDDEGAKKYYSYYQWVCFALFFQAILCYVPKWLWDAWEGGLMKNLVMGLNIGLWSEEDKNKKKEIILKYLISHIRGHNTYALRYWTCEVMCLINIILQLYFMNRFFDGEFLTYGLRVLSVSETVQGQRVDPMVYIFPRVTKCTFHKYGPTGSIQKHDSLCILPLNIVNEKTYIFIWFWYMFLANVLTFLILYRIVLFSCPSIRPHLLRFRNRLVPLEVAVAVTRKTDMGDWWVLYMLSRNMDPLIFREVIMELAKKIDINQYKDQ